MLPLVNKHEPTASSILLPEAFLIYLKISMVVACLLTLPVLLYHLGFSYCLVYTSLRPMIGCSRLGVDFFDVVRNVLRHQCLVPPGVLLSMGMGSEVSPKGSTIFKSSWRLEWKIMSIFSFRS